MKPYLVPNVVRVGRCNFKCIQQTGANRGEPRCKDQEVPVVSCVRDNKASYTASNDAGQHEWNTMNKKNESPPTSDLLEVEPIHVDTTPSGRVVFNSLEQERYC